MDDDIQSQGYFRVVGHSRRDGSPHVDTIEKEKIKEGKKNTLISEWSWNKELLVNPKYRT